LTNNHNTHRTLLARVLVVVLATTFLLSACGGRGKLRDLDEYIAKLNQTAAASLKKKDITAMQLPVPAIYQSSTLRDPFQESTISYSEKGMVNPVNAFPLNMLRYAGMLTIGNRLWAVILIPDGRIYQLALGDVVGDHEGRITKIAVDHVEITEQITDDNQRTAQRLVILQLKDGAR
jgi:type IV pilus assembly protein PilP